MHKKSFLFNQDCHWKTNHPGIRQSLPLNVQSWVYECGSLTKRLRHYYGSSLAVEILYHRWRPAFLSECTILKLPHQQYNLIREVLLHAEGKPLILARTVLPEKTIKIAKRNLSHLGTRPLGEVIFSYPKLERLQLNISYIKLEQWTQELTIKTPITNNIWGRRTIYSIHKQQLLVSEFFLPGALELFNK